MRAIALLLLCPLGAAVPGPAGAQIGVRPDFCRLVSAGPPAVARAHFTVENSGALPVCRIEFIPEPKPVTERCRVSACDAVAGSCQLTAVGGALWQLGTGACVDPGTALGGFRFELEQGPCCYYMNFYGPGGEYLGGYEECFCSDAVQALSTTWGRLKSTHR